MFAEIVDGKQSGIYAYEASSLEVEQCRFSGNKSNSVSVCCQSIGSARARVARCWMRHARDAAGVVLRTRAAACSLELRVEHNTLEDCDTGVVLWTRGDDDKVHPTDDPIAPCPHGAACPGACVLLADNEIPHPHSHG